MFVEVVLTPPQMFVLMWTHFPYLTMSMKIGCLFGGVFKLLCGSKRIHESNFNELNLKFIVHDEPSYELLLILLIFQSYFFFCLNSKKTPVTINTLFSTQTRTVFSFKLNVYNYQLLNYVENCQSDP